VASSGGIFLLLIPQETVPFPNSVLISRPLPPRGGKRCFLITFRAGRLLFFFSPPPFPDGLWPRSPKQNQWRDELSSGFYFLSAPGEHLSLLYYQLLLPGARLCIRSAIPRSHHFDPPRYGKKKDIYSSRELDRLTCSSSDTLSFHTAIFFSLTISISLPSGHRLLFPITGAS